jgi:hypothetical protein
MVKNTIGGSKTKALARKNISHGPSSDTIRLPTNELEQFAVVTKILGNGMCYVQTNLHQQLICHIRNKFRGRSKKNNLVSSLSTILIGLRDWETNPKNCDLLEIYSDLEIPILQLPSSLLRLIRGEPMVPRTPPLCEAGPLFETEPEFEDLMTI